ncbi:MAG: acetyl-CoA carboxylase biotin carboxyl carrier protein [Acidobacteria bacterium]|nr:acetyl-CoA carboxylase biotin carboxyl carrier protein [Acidobacteriota bacterium]
MPKKSAGRGGEASEAAWNLKEIRALMDVLEERQISEFEMERGGTRIRIKRGGLAVETPQVPLYGNNHSHVWPAPAPEPSATPPASGMPAATDAAETVEDVHLVKSPIVGTFYNSPSPNAPPFVSVGDEVQVGQPLCIIEAMKLMNEIESDSAGEVVRIYMENGQPVEYGQSLYAIRPSHKI